MLGRRRAVPLPPPRPVIQVRGRAGVRQAARLYGPGALAEAPPSLLYRYRRQMVPVWWLPLVTLPALVMHMLRLHAQAAIAGLILAAVFWALSRHVKDKWVPKACTVAAALTAVSLPLVALWPKPGLLAFAACWAAFTLAWLHHYRIRADAPVIEDECALWARTLGAEGQLAGSVLSKMENMPGGARYRLQLVRGKHDTSNAFSMSKKIASQFAKPVTEAFPERFPDAREHEVMLTILRQNTLQTVREWDGSSIDPATGLAVIGDYPDGKPALYQYFSPRNGASQSVVAGVTGSGKTALLYLLCVLALTSKVPVIPFVLDPQQGQSLPDLRGCVPYARGADECFAALRAIDVAMTARSEYMANLPWTDAEGIVHEGTDHYDPHTSQLPLILIVFDEAHVVFKDGRYGKQAIEIVGKLAKLNRKAGAHLIVAAHALLLAELGDNTLRSMVVSGNAIALRTGDGFTGGVIGLEADPKQLPRRFPDGSPTHGLGYMAGPSQRPDSPMRVRWLANPRKHALAHPARDFDPVFGDAFRSALAVQAVAGQPGAASLCKQFRVSDAHLQMVMDATVAEAERLNPPADDSPAPGGQTAADAILAVLTGQMDRGQILEATEMKAKQWGRKPWLMRQVSAQLKTLSDSGRIQRLQHPDGKAEHYVYAPQRAA